MGPMMAFAKITDRHAWDATLADGVVKHSSHSGA